MNFFDDQLGLALIGGTEIRSDSLADHRFDKVMPLWAEEHLVTAAVLDKIDLEDKKVLEIGCGSGVFSILCAQAGAHVLAVDSSMRAISATLMNAARNDVSAQILGKETQEAGTISLLHHAVSQLDTDPKWDWRSGGREFDVVIITPPYNPTFDALTPALHAGAGPDGQAAFMLMLEPAISALSKSGVLVCNHMDIVHSGNEGVAERMIQDRMGERFGSCVLQRYSCLPSAEYDARRFLNGQYRQAKAFFRTADKNSYDKLMEYIADIPDGSKFALSTFLAEAGGEGEFTTEIRKDFASIARRHRRSWQSRIDLHSQINASSCPASMTPLPVRNANFELQRADFGGKLVADRSDESVRFSARVGFDPTTFLKANRKDDQFDLLMVDFAPLPETVHGSADLDNELSIWISDRLATKMGKQSQDAIQNFAEAWQRNTGRQQGSTTGTFLHPSFTGVFAPYGRTLAHRTSRQPSAYGKRVGSVMHAATNFAAWKRAVAVDARKPVSNSDYKEQHLSKQIGFYKSSLQDLSVIEAMQFIDSLVKSHRIDVLLSGLEGNNFDEKILAAVRSKVSNWKPSSYDDSQSLQAIFSDVGSSQILEKTFQLDAQYCHSNMHQALDKLVKKTVGKIGEKLWSNLASLPLRVPSIARDLRFREISTARSDGVPDHYRGGVWIYAASLDGNEAGFIDQQSAFEEILNQTWLHHLDKHNTVSIENSVDKALHDTAHQIRSHLDNMHNQIQDDDGIATSIKAKSLVLSLLFDVHLAPDNIAESMTPIAFDQLLTAAWDAGTERAFRRVRDSKKKEENRKTAADRQLYRGYLEAISAQNGDKHLLKEEMLNKWVIPDTSVLQSLVSSYGVKSTAFDVMIFSALWQSYAHSIRFSWENRSEAVLNVAATVNSGQLEVVITNSGGDTTKAGSKDAKFLQFYKSRLTGVLDVSGPVKIPDVEIWETRICFDLSQISSS